MQDMVGIVYVSVCMDVIQTRQKPITVWYRKTTDADISDELLQRSVFTGLAPQPLCIQSYPLKGAG